MQTETRAATASRTASATPSPTVTPTHTPPITATIEPANEAPLSITTEGRYLLDVQTGELYLASGAVAWAPGGKIAAIMQCCSVAGGLAIVNMDTGERQEVASGYATGLAWSPDGRQLAYSHVVGLPNSFDREGIYLYDVSRHETRHLADVHGISGVSWRPDWGLLVLVIKPKVYLMDPSTGGSSEIVDFGPDSDSISPAWSPDGNRLAICVLLGNAAAGWTLQLSVYDVATGQLTHWADVSSCQQLQWLQDGKRILLGGWGDAYEVTEGAAPAVLLSNVRNIALSPDEQQLAYISDGCITGEFDVYVAEADGSGARRLTNTPDQMEEALTWSPDGQKLSFSIGSLDRQEVQILDLSTGAVQTVAAAEALYLHLHGASWSPDGRYLMFGLDGGHGICD